MAAHWTSRIAWLTALVLSLSLLTGCPSTSGPPAGDNVPPTIAAIPDQTVIRNTSSPRSVVVMLAIQDPDDDAFDVTVTSSDDEVISGTTLTCGLDPCALTLTPSPESTAQVTLQVTVTDASGGQAETSFDLHVVPRLVSNAADSGEGSLRQTVLDAEPGDVIGFDTSGTFAVPRTVTLATQIVLDKDLTIEGTGSDRLTLSGNDQVRVFEVTTSAIVLLRDLTVTKGLAEDGGGILVAFGSVLVLHASAVSGSAAQRFGGGIYNRGTLDVVAGSRVSGNEAGVHGGGIYNDDDGSTTIRASTVGGTGPGAANTADHGGGVHNRGRLNVLEGSHVVGNRAQVFGGGIYNDDDGSTTIRASTVGGNVVEGDGGSGGGIYNDGVLDILEGSRIRGNEAPDGGGIRNHGTTTIHASTVGGTSEDDANRATTEFGGGIDNRDRLDILGGSLVTGNVALGGGGISAVGDATTTVSGSTVSNNVAFLGGGIYSTGRLTLTEDSHVSGNEATHSGGGIFNAGGDVTISASTVGGTTPDHANIAQLAGGIANTGSLTLRARSRVVGNEATLGSGGGIYSATPSAEVHLLERSAITHNTARVDGGGILLEVTNLYVEGLNFIESNSAGRNGGGVWVGGAATFNGGSVSSNRADRNGGGLYVANLTSAKVTVTATGCRIFVNLADANDDGEGQGGGIYNAGGDISGVSSGHVCHNQPDDFAP
jgi:fibronectin-binding autotransporter adhesin